MMRLFKWLRAEKGGATVEFVLVFPVILTIFFISLETSTILVRQGMLERAVDITARSLRLSNEEGLTSQAVANRICRRARIIRDCHATITLDLRAIPRPNYVLPALGAPCINREQMIRPVTRFDPSQTAPNELMLLRACVSIDPLLPFSEFVLDLTRRGGGGLFLEASTIFVSEPQVVASLQ